MAATGSDDEKDVGVQVRVNFILDKSVQDRSLEVPVEPISVPADIRRKGLSAVINHLLDRRVDADNEEEEEEDDSDKYDNGSDGGKLPAIPFDFVVSKKLLRTGVESAARRYGLSLEQSIPVTYFPAQQAPEEEGESEPNPDWIAALSYENGFVYSGGYDGSLRLFSESHDGLVAASSAAAHTGPIKCMSVSSGLLQSGQSLIATGSMDQTIALHSFEGNAKTLRKVAECGEGHTSSIGCVEVYAAEQKMVSGDWDGGLCLWDLKAVGGNDRQRGEPTKKHKSETGGKAVGVSALKPAAFLPAHTSQISGAAWLGGDKVVTGSWDHSVKVWNVDREECGLTLNGSRVVSCLDLSPHSEVLATGHPDCTVRLWDIRMSATEASNLVSDSSLRPSHKAWVSAVRWSPGNPFVLSTASHDGTMKVWDIRSSIPLHTVRVVPKEEKALCLAFADGTVYTGGSDCIVKRYSLQ